MTNYPYYMVTCFDAGVLVKFRFETRNGKKFKTSEEALDAVGKFKAAHKNYDKQICIIEYTDQYQANIKYVINNNELTAIY